MTAILPKLIRLDKPAQPSSFGAAKTPFGQVTIFWQQEMLVRLDLRPMTSLDEARCHGLARQDDRARALADGWWHDTLSQPVMLGFYGTAFRHRVMQEMISVPRGQTATYAGLAHAAGFPGAARAAGSTCAKNPLPLVVPCHRVLSYGNRLGGFGYGQAMKRCLLDNEGAVYTP